LIIVGAYNVTLNLKGFVVCVAVSALLIFAAVHGNYSPKFNLIIPESMKPFLLFVCHNEGVILPTIWAHFVSHDYLLLSITSLPSSLIAN
tara:strand:- start:108 stop:377 length:270 start_codon:yes stop_codon:yes gene_type:complete